MCARESQSIRAEDVANVPQVADRFKSGLMKIAVYRNDEPNEKFTRNPLVTCLPALLSDGVAQAALASEPAVRDSKFFKLPLEVRREYAADISEIFVPADSHIRAIRRLMEILRNSYKHFEPCSPEFMAYLCGVRSSEEQKVSRTANISADVARSLVAHGLPRRGDEPWEVTHQFAVRSRR